jgi:serine/threonine protein kinase
MEQPAVQFLPLNCQSNNDDLSSRSNLGRYRILNQIGEGGIARVFLARDDATGELTALKIARPENPDAVDALRNEFRFAITHPHPLLVTPLSLIYDGEVPVIIMPYVTGNARNDDGGRGRSLRCFSILISYRRLARKRRGAGRSNT